jgi:hypothetical protein
VDTDKECYEKLQYYRFGYLDLVKLLFSTKWRDAIAKVRLSWTFELRDQNQQARFFSSDFN